MAITSDALKDVLKTYYAKEGVANLLFKNSPTLAKIEQETVSGATANFATNYGRSPAVASSLTKVEELLKKDGRVAEFKVSPKNIFTGAAFGEKELLASADQRGAYLPIAELKMFNACEGYRKYIAQAFFSDGYGVIGSVPATDSEGAAITTIAKGDSVSLVWDYYQIAYIDVGSQVVFKKSKTDSDKVSTIFEVESVEGQKVTLKNTTGAYSRTEGDVITSAGVVSEDGESLMPVGLAGWLPKELPSTEAASKFMGVDRTKCRDRLAGSHIVALSGEKKYETLKRAILALSMYNSACDMIVMNNIDKYEMAKEIEALTYFTKPDGGKGKTKAQVGYSDFGFSVNDNFLDNVIADPYCPKGTAYVLDSSVLKMWVFNNAKALVDNDPSSNKPEVSSTDGDKPTRPFQMLIDNIFTVKDGESTENGNVSLVEISTFLNFVVTAPALCASVELN